MTEELPYADAAAWEITTAAAVGATVYTWCGGSPAVQQAAALRLERQARLSPSWASRREAANALGKVALLASEPVRIDAFAALCDLARDPDGMFDVRDVVLPPIRLLDEVYGLLAKRETWGSDVDASLLERVEVLVGGLPAGGFSFRVDWAAAAVAAAVVASDAEEADGGDGDNNNNNNNNDDDDDAATMEAIDEGGEGVAVEVT